MLLFFFFFNLVSGFWLGIGSNHFYFHLFLKRSTKWSSNKKGRNIQSEMCFYSWLCIFKYRCNKRYCIPYSLSIHFFNTCFNVSVSTLVQGMKLILGSLRNWKRKHVILIFFNLVSGFWLKGENLFKKKQLGLSRNVRE